MHVNTPVASSNLAFTTAILFQLPLLSNVPVCKHNSDVAKFELFVSCVVMQLSM